MQLFFFLNKILFLIRIRPPVEGLPYAQCAKKEQQIILADGKEFTFDYVYDTFVQQADIYNGAIDRLVKRSLEGFNATVLAYGQVKFIKCFIKICELKFHSQTGTGKTYTMGIDFYKDKDREGIIPRAVRHIFSVLENNNESHQFNVDVQFLEIYKEKIYDLLGLDDKVIELESF